MKKVLLGTLLSFFSCVSFAQLNIYSSWGNASCAGSLDGFVQVDSVPGGIDPLTYLWNTGATTQMVNGLGAAMYTVTVTDFNSFTDVDTVYVNEPSSLSSTANINNETSGASCDGWASVNTSGGTPPYTYLWSSGSDSISDYNLCAGLVVVTVTDANGCTEVLNANIGTGTGNYFSWNMTCLNDSTEFTATLNDVGAVQNIDWYFGEGGSAIGAGSYVKYQYPDTGNYLVTMVVIDTLSATDTITSWVYISDCGGGVKLSDFSWSSGCVSDTISFWPLGDMGQIASYLWTFGDGDSAFVSSPMHLFADTGNYMITLITTDTAGWNDTTVNYLWIGECAGASNYFNWGMTCINDSTEFYPNVADPGATLQVDWNFGDGGAATGADWQTMKYKYASVGTYDVWMVVIDTLGGQDSIYNQVTIDSCTVMSDFGWNMTCLNDSTEFYPNVANPGATLQVNWDFGDGTTDTGADWQTMKHQYADTGMYNVLMVIVDTIGGQDSVMHQVYINNCGGGVKLSDFSWSSGCVSDTVSFWPLGDMGQIASYLWTFGDGDSAFVSSPMHLFADTGNYMVTLITTDTTGWNDTSINYLWIGECVSPSNSFWFDFTCVGDSTQFNPNFADAGNVSNVAWDFGDGMGGNSMGVMYHQYADTGSYNVMMVVTDTLGGTDTVYNMVWINGCGAVSDFNWSMTCINDSTEFYPSIANPGATLQVDWNFGDGGAATGADWQTMKYKYASVGTFDVWMVVIDTIGGQDSIYHQVTIDSCMVMSDFGWNMTCLNDSTEFYPNVANPGATLQVNWDFGDGTTDTGAEWQTMKHQYADTGMYNILMVVVDTIGGQDSVMHQVYINNCGGGVSLSDFGWNIGCVNDSASFWPNGNMGQISTYQWSFGDGNTSTMSNPMHLFADTGNYMVQLVVMDTIGSYDTTAYNIWVGECPGNVSLADFTWNGCAQDTMFFNPLGDVGAIAAYQWNFGDGNTSTVGFSFNQYADTGSYQVQLVVTDTIGMNDTVTYQVYVGDCGEGTYADFNWDNNCVSQLINFADSSTHSGIITWNWNFGDGSTSTLQNPSHTYSVIGQYNVLMVVSDGVGTDSVMYMIDVVDCGGNDYVDFNWDNNCMNQTVNFSDSSTYQAAAGWNWDFGDGSSSVLQNPTHTYTAIGSYSVTLAVDIDGINSDSATYVIDIIDCTQLPPAMTVTASSTDITCNGAQDGTATLSVVAGATPYSYNWSNGANTAMINGLASGSYSATVTDANGFNEMVSVSISEPAPVSVSVVSQTNVSCYMKNDGTASVVGSGGVGGYAFVWSNGKVKATITGLIAKTYTVVAVDSNGCQSVPDTVVVTQPANLMLSSFASNANCQQADGSVSIVAVGGVSPYGYNWQDGSTGNMLSNITSGGYGVTVTDASGCIATTYAMVGDNDGPTVSILSVTDANCGGNDGQVFTEVTGGQQPYTYLWNNGVTAPHLLNALAGEASVVVIDNNGCSGAANTTISSLGTLPPSISGYVTTSLSGFIVNTGTVSILIPNPYGGSFIKVGETDLDINGYYAFDAITPIGEYTLKVVADTMIPAYKNTVPTYNGLVNRWQDAVIINTVCDSAFEQDLVIKELPPLNGSNSLGGFVGNDGSNKMFGGRAGDPIPGVDVSLEQIPGGIIAYTETDVDGRFAFNNVPVSDSSYTIYVDIPGLPMQESYVVDLSTVSNGSDSTIATLDFLVSDSIIYPATSPSFVYELPKEEKQQLFVYPNPFKGYTNITYQVEEISNVTLEVYNILGERLYATSTSTLPGTYNIRFDGSDYGYTSGIFIVRLAVGDQISTARITEVE